MKEIQLTQGKVAIVDDDDFELLSKWKWYFDGGYAIRSTPTTDGKQTKVKMHRDILGVTHEDRIHCDHINGDTSDNRRENLRLCSNAENGKNRRIGKNNTSGFKGVCWCKRNKKWIAYIKTNGKQKTLGYFDIQEAAHAAYCKAAIEQHGEFANFGNGCISFEQKA